MLFRARLPEGIIFSRRRSPELRLLKVMLKAGGKQRVPQGWVISPLLSNIDLTEVDRMLQRAKEATRCAKYASVEYASSLTTW